MPDGEIKWILAEVKRLLCIEISPALEGTQDIPAIKALSKVVEEHLPKLEKYISIADTIEIEQ